MEAAGTVGHPPGGSKLKHGQSGTWGRFTIYRQAFEFYYQTKEPSQFFPEEN